MTGPARDSFPADQAAPSDQAEIAAEIEATRAALGETVAALAAKADVKARLADSAVAAKERIADTGSEVASSLSHSAGAVVGLMERLVDHFRRNPLPWLIGGAAALIALAATRRRRT